MNVLLDSPDYKNQKNTIHNNIGMNVLEKQIFKNVLFIDSEFRDYSIYKNPFNFIVKFNGREPHITNVHAIVDNNIYTYTKYCNGDNCVLIDRVFKNIVAITIDTLFMPTSVDYKLVDGDYVPNDEQLNKFYCKYIVLKINEIANEKHFTNNKKLGSNSFVMIYDDINGRYGGWVPVVDTITYPVSNLKVIDKLTIEICDERGDPFYMTLDGKSYDFYAEYCLLIDKAKNTPGSITDADKIRLKTLKNITQYMSPELHITFSILEPQINTQPLFRH